MPDTGQQPGAVKIAPSILAADFAAMGHAVREAERAGADALHVDVMDGHFVPEISFGRRMVETVRKQTKLPLDVHLMVANPGRHIGAFAEAGAQVLTLHVEAVNDPEENYGLLEEIRGAGMGAGVALKPSTGPEMLESLWPVLDRVLVMTVEPGYSGQTFMPEMLSKISAVAERTWQLNHPVEVAVDGGVDVLTIVQCVAAGATFLVAGSSVYSSRRTVADGIAMLRRAVNAESAEE